MVANPRLAVGLLEFLEKADVRLVVRGVHLDLDAPPGVLTPELLQLIKSLKPDLVHELDLRSPCARCGSGMAVDVPIHDGRSTRRDCAVCGRVKGFPEWSERAVRWEPPRGDRGWN